MITGTVAAAFLLGGAGLLQLPQAHADAGTNTAAASMTTSTVQASTNAATVKEGNTRGNQLLEQVSKILGVDQAAMTDELKQGKSFIQFINDNGMSEAGLLQKLSNAKSQSLTDAVTAGTITQDQADQQLAPFTSRLKKEIENPTVGLKQEKPGFDRKKNIVKDALAVLNVDKATMADQLKQGKTLLQIAQDKGMTEDVLLQKLTTAVNQSIDAAVASGTVTQAQADEQKSGLADRLKKEIERAGKQNEFHAKTQFGLSEDQASQLLGLTPQNLISDLQAGQSLADIATVSGINEEQLISQIKDSLTNKIKQYVEKKRGNRCRSGIRRLSSQKCDPQLQDES